MMVLRDLSIKHKVTLVLLLTSSAVLLAAFGALFVFAIVTFKQSYTRDLGAVCEITANNCNASVVFQDAKACDEVLSALKARSDILSASVVLTDWTVFANFGRPVARSTFHDVTGDGPSFLNGDLWYAHPIRVSGSRIATLYLRTDYSTVFERLLQFYVGIFAVMLAACVLLAVVLASFSQRLISGPILELADTARKVAAKRDYAARAGYPGRDELGVLVDTFNQMLEQIEEYNRALEEKVAHRTEELKHAKDVAEAASRAKTQFLANMSHELRTPITGVMGMLQLLERTELKPKQMRYVHQSLDSADALLTVIGDILDFSKIEAGKLQLEAREFLLRNLLHSTVRQFAGRAETKGIELFHRVDENVPDALRGDDNRLRQVLINLIGNSLKFTEKGEISLTCRKEPSPPRSPAETQTPAFHQSITLRFEVRDTGCGIAPRDSQRIFDAFSQGDNSMTRSHGGTGLGLSISRQLCEAMGGSLGMESRPGVGSKFWFTVRIKTDPHQHTEKVRNLKNMRVLVVDDSPSICELIGDYVKSWMGRPIIARNVTDALRELTEARRAGDPFSVAVLDGKLPDRGCSALAREIRQDEELRKTGLVLLSGFTGGDESEAEGFSAFVLKPFDDTDLFDALIIASKRRTERRRTEQTPSSGPTTSVLKSSRNILLVEDNEVNREVATEFIRELGYVCHWAGTGFEAVATVKNGGMDLVLMDCQMPGMDGYEAARQIRDWEKTAAKQRLPIVALTAHATNEDRDRCLAAGMDDYLSKPVNPEMLAKTLAKYLDPETP